jgi:hypothetical protein
MNADDPLAAGVLRHLAATRGPADPLGSLARSVLSGQASLREAVTWSWHGEAMATEFAGALRERDRMTAAERAAYDRQAADLSRRLEAHERPPDPGAEPLGGPQSSEHPPPGR